ncbi:MAG: hypothetical protein ACI8XO_004698 [Verrucomicrobiales bacterium]|jgi:hypothetical protein
MDTDIMNTESSRVAEEAPAIPTVIAKNRAAGEAPPVGLGSPSKDDQNTAEIARLSAWATGDCGKPILAD